MLNAWNIIHSQFYDNPHYLLIASSRTIKFIHKIGNKDDYYLFSFHSYLDERTPAIFYTYFIFTFPTFIYIFSAVISFASPIFIIYSLNILNVLAILNVCLPFFYRKGSTEEIVYPK